MIDITSLDDFALLRETVDLECKLAAGRDGRGAVPEDFWPTYSAFANTDGGLVVLGLREKQGSFSVEGIQDAAKVRKDLFDMLNNRQKVSVNLLTDDSVKEVVVQGCTLLVIHTPRATRKQRPVHITSNPFAGHTFRRLNDGDRAIADDDVRRMIAEQVEDSLDSRILRGFGFDDLCMETFRAYRQVFANRDSAHPWNALNDDEFLRQLGGWRKDRESGESGLTLAGLLMFGWMASIQGELPNYMLDYQERPEAKIEQRWRDRLTLDGKWSGNLYDFYRKVYLKLTAELKVPFSLKNGQREDETPVHVALREALANTLVHGDYSDRASVLVVKRPDMFGFRNPGLMRIPPEVAIQGGEHDCRNRTLHKMFRLVGVGEQAGSGVPKIYGGWASQHWRAPSLFERQVPYNQTLMELRMIDLLPEDLIASLKAAFGVKFDSLQQNERMTLAAAASEETVSHARVREMTNLHPVDATRLLKRLVQDRFLEAHNGGRGAVYCVAGAGLPRAEEVFGLRAIDSTNDSSVFNSSPNLAPSSPNLASSSPNSVASSPNLAVNPTNPSLNSSNSTGQRDINGCLIASQLPLPIIDNLEQLSDSFRQNLELLAEEPRSKRRIDRERLIEVILQICLGHFVTLSSLAKLVDRQPDTLRDQYLSKLVRERTLSLAFPTTPTHERQAYCTTDSLQIRNTQTTDT
jgi:ATP-dependent DNA helicase RecG